VVELVSSFFVVILVVQQNCTVQAFGRYSTFNVQVLLTLVLFSHNFDCTGQRLCTWYNISVCFSWTAHHHDPPGMRAVRQIELSLTPPLSWRAKLRSMIRMTPTIRRSFVKYAGPIPEAMSPLNVEISQEP